MGFSVFRGLFQGSYPVNALCYKEQDMMQEVCAMHFWVPLKYSKRDFSFSIAPHMCSCLLSLATLNPLEEASVSLARHSLLYPYISAQN